MDDLDKWIISLAKQRTHSVIIALLDRAAEIESRTEAKGDERRAAVERVHRIERILVFLRSGLDDRGATDANKEVCTKIRDRLTARGAW